MKMRSILMLWAVVVGISPASEKAQALDGNIGTLSLTGFLLEPMFRWSDEASARQGFRFSQSQLGVDWTLDQTVRGVLRVGNASQVGKSGGPSEGSSDLGVVEAYAEYRLPVGFLRAGLIPIGFGWEGWTREANLRFGRSQFYQDQYVAIRDLGLSYLVSHNRFYSLFAVHNGESDVDTDDRSLFTLTVGYLASAGLNMGLSGQTGRFFSGGQEVRGRLVNGFLRWGGARTSLRLEATNGDIRALQPGQQLVANVLSYRVEASQEIGTLWGVQARYDHLNRDTTQQGAVLNQVQYGLFWSNAEETSTVFLIGVKNQPSSLQSESNEVRLIWRLNDQAVRSGEEFTGLVRSEL